MKLGRSFFSLYFLIISLFIITTWLLDEFWNSYIEQDIESYTGYKTMLIAVGDFVQKQPVETWETLVENTGKRYELPLSLLSADDLQSDIFLEHNKLKKDDTHVYYHNDEVVLHHLISGTNKIISLGPAKMPTRPRIEATIRVIVFLVLGVIIFIWLWPLSKDLDQLQKSTREFGRGDFAVKVPSASSSIMKPMVGAFNMMAHRIKRLINAHKELTNAVAHELRTPLARSKFALQMLSSVKDEEKKEKYLQQISADISELDELINEMLLYASFDSERPELKFEAKNISQIVNNQIERFDHTGTTIDFVSMNSSIEADCDYHFIERAIQNYISNAVKYGDGQIRVSLAANSEHCTIKVEDNGKGVSEEFKETVFDAFSRGDNSRNRETGGFGLGLAIVGKIMEWHNGSVNVEDSELGGASFSFTWPLKKGEIV